MSVDGDLTISSPSAVLECALAGMGPTLLPNWLVDPHLAAGRLVDLLPALRASPTNFETAAWLLYPSRAFLPIKTRVAIDFLREHLR